LYGTADVVLAQTVTVRVIWTDGMGQSNSRDLMLKVATAWKH
jgi:hypothetical protein